MASISTPADTTGGEHDYPLTFAVDYPDRDLDRMSTAFRILTIIPIAILAGLLGGGNFATNAGGSGARSAGISGVGILVIPVVLMLLFRHKYPRWWYEWNLQLTRFSSRVAVYFALMDDHYPSTDEQQSVHLDFPYPDAEHELSRGLPLVKWLLAIPHFFVLFFLTIAALIATMIAWFAILLTGRYPRPLFDFVEGVIRWYSRVGAYAFLLITDRYPPFSLNA
jgi:small-conductance mechanosensitive channel